MDQNGSNTKPDGYMESIRKGSAGLNRFRGVYYGSGDREAETARLKRELLRELQE